jgi:hypothetical protein
MRKLSVNHPNYKISISKNTKKIKYQFFQIELYNEIARPRETMQIRRVELVETSPDFDRVLRFATLLTLASVHLLICLIANFFT